MREVTVPVFEVCEAQPVVTGDKREGGIDILTKAASIIAFLRDVPDASVSAISAAVNQPTSSVYRLIKSLVAVGWVDVGPERGAYRLGLGFLHVGALLEDSLDVRVVGMPHLRSLRNITSLAVLLCYRKSRHAVCVERLEGRDARSVVMLVGDSLPLYVGGAPVALLSFLPPGEQHALLDSFTLPPTSKRYPVPPRSKIEHIINETRLRGYSRSEEDVTPGIAALGAPIFNYRGELVAALSVSGLSAAVLDDERAIAREVVNTARQISRELGLADLQ